MENRIEQANSENSSFDASAASYMELEDPHEADTRSKAKERKKLMVFLVLFLTMYVARTD